MRLFLLFPLLVMAVLAANQVQGPDGMPGHKALLQRQDSASLLYETGTVLYVDFIPALSTSTVYQTTQITITGCLPSVSSCPDVSTTFVTATTAVYTTLCPVTLTSMRIGRMTVPMATSTTSLPSGTSMPSTVGSFVGTAPGSSNTSSTNVAYTATDTRGQPPPYSTASSTPSSFNRSSSWPVTIFSTHSSTILLGASSEASVYPTVSTTPSSFNDSRPMLSTSFGISSTPFAYPTASVTASLFNGSVVTAGNSTRSVSFRMPLPIGLTTRAVATYWNATTGGSLVVPTAPSPVNGTVVLTPGGGATYSTATQNSSAAAGNPNSTQFGTSLTVLPGAAVPTPVNATTSSYDFGSTNTSESAALTSSTLASASLRGNISSIALKPTVQPFVSGAESETTSSLVFCLVALVYLVILVEF